MALINCPECGKEISDKAEACPNCGYSINTPVKAKKKSRLFKSKKSKITLMICALLFAVVVTVVYIYTGLPNFKNMNLDEAEKILTERKIGFDVEYKYTKDLEKDVIYNQSIKPYSHAVDEKLILYVSLGKEYTMPDIIGQQVDAVQDELDSIPHEYVYEYSHTDEEGTIISSSEKVGTVFYDSNPVVITVSKGLYKKLDDLKGKNIDEVQQYLDGLGLKYDIERKYSLDFDANFVTEYTPDEYAETGETIKLTVSEGLGILIPDLTALPKDNIDKLAQDKGFTVNYVNSYKDIECDLINNKNVHKLISQSVSGCLPKGTIVDIECSSPAIEIVDVGFECNYVGGVDTFISFKNNSDKQIAYVDFNVKYYDSMGNPAKCSIRNTSTANLQYTGPLNAGGKSKKIYWDAVIYDSTTSAMMPLSIKITFSDGTKQIITNSGRYWTIRGYYGGDLND